MSLECDDEATGEFNSSKNHMWYFWWFTNLATWDGWSFKMELFISNSAGFGPAFWIEAPKKKDTTMDPHKSPWLRVFQKRPKEMDVGLEWRARVRNPKCVSRPKPPLQKCSFLFTLKKACFGGDISLQKKNLKVCNKWSPTFPERSWMSWSNLPKTSWTSNSNFGSRGFSHV